MFWDVEIFKYGEREREREREERERERGEREREMFLRVNWVQNTKISTLFQTFSATLYIKHQHGHMTRHRIHLLCLPD